MSTSLHRSAFEVSVSKRTDLSSLGLRPLATKPSPQLKHVFGFHAENHGESFAVVCLSVDGKHVKRVTVFDSFLWPQREVSFNDMAAELKRYNAKGASRLESIPIAWERSAEPFANGCSSSTARCCATIWRIPRRPKSRAISRWRSRNGCERELFSVDAGRQRSLARGTRALRHRQ
jgi:hypothetical protein